MHINRALLGLLGIYAFIQRASANELKISDGNDDRQVCSGIYSKKDWNGKSDSFIDVALKPSNGKDDNDWIALVIFEYRNVDMIGVGIPGENNKKYICDDTAVASGLCNSENIGKFILEVNSNATSYAPIVTEKISIKEPKAVRYPIPKSGFYCVSTYPGSSELKYKGVARFQNAFGQLAASEVPKLSFYGGAAIAYLVVFCFWMFSYVQHRSDILPVQNYITAISGFLVVEMICIWGYYDYYNSRGNNTGTFVYLIVLSVLNSFRNAFTFFLLLIVCLGYGVVVPSLGNMMWKCRALAGAHFVFAVVYSITTYISTPDQAGWLALILIAPLGITMTTFYVWILSALTFTIKTLDDKKQHVKATMYKNLWRLLLGSIVVIFGFFFLNSLIFSQETTLEYITKHWQSRWFLFDGWLNVVYFLDFCIVSFLWRPSANNRRFAMSTELSQDETGQEFEIDSFDIGGVDDDDEDEDEDDNESTLGFRRANPFSDDNAEDAREIQLAEPTTEEIGETVFSVEDEEQEHEDEPTHEGTTMLRS